MKRRRSQRVEVACPHCAHLQWEANGAVSTFCRGCGTHFEISHGRALSTRPGKPATNLRLASDDLWNGGSALKAALSTEPARNGANNTSIASAPHSQDEDSDPTREMRTVACFECGCEEEVVASANSATCPSCKAHISLRNVHVRNDSRKKIKTRGDVTVHHNASLQGSNLCCRNLKVMGSISGNVECTGTASFYSDSRVRGVLSCEALRIRKNIVVHFEHAVNAREVEIAGEAFGHFFCSGGVEVGPEGLLRGEVIARTIKIDPTGTLEASLRICSLEPKPSPARPANDTSQEDSPVSEEEPPEAEDEPSVWVRGKKIFPASA